MTDYSYLEIENDDYEKLSNNIDDNPLINFFVGDSCGLGGQFGCDDDNDIYKEKIELKETRQTENEEELNNCNVENNNSKENLIDSIEYIPEKINIEKKEEKKSKRGRRKKNEKFAFECYNGKTIEHNKFKPDNIRIKIKTHFHNFIISFFNDFIKNRFKIQRFKFRKISYEITKDVTVKNNEKLIKMTLGEFLSQNISKKYKYHSDQNEKTVLTLKNMVKSNFDKDLFNIYYYDFYNNYYMSSKKIEISEQYGISKNTEFFVDFIQKIDNEKYVKSIVDIANNHFIQYFNRNDTNINNNNNFLNENYENNNSFLEKKRKNDNNIIDELNMYINFNHINNMILSSFEFEDFNKN